MPRRPRVLIINPNTSEAVSANIAALAREEADGYAEIAVVTARFGAAYVGSRATVAIAEHAVIDAYATWTRAEGEPDAIVVGCFGDPGLSALREIVPIPVIGFAEAAMRDASGCEGRFVVATSGAAWVAILSELVHALRIESHVAAVIEIRTENVDDEAVASAIQRSVEGAGAARLILGGSGLIPRMPRIAELVRVPLIDPHRLAIRQAIALAAQAGADGHAAPSQPRTRYRGLSPDLEALLSREGEGRPA